jgi:mRNA interferase YafQ
VREIIRSVQFKRDVRLAEKRGKDMAKLRELILLMAEKTPLPPRYKDHPLSGEWKGTLVQPLRKVSSQPAETSVSRC